jgi:TolB protein
VDKLNRKSSVAITLYTHLRQQLEWSGFFRVLNEATYPAHRGLERIGRTTIDYQAWHQSGAYAVLKGELKRNQGDVIVTLHLYLTEEGRQVQLPLNIQRLPSADPRTLKLAAARWVDDMVRHFTGKPGVASTRLVFAHRKKRGGAKEIRVVDLDGGYERAITKNGSINVLPAWTPDGRVAYTSFKNSNSDLYIGGRVFSSRPRMNTGAAFFHDGTKVALTLSRDGNPEIYILDAKTGEEQLRVTQHPAIDTSPTWSPSGRRLAFVTDRYTGRPQIAITSAHGGEVQRPAQVGGYNTGPDWSPIGPTVVYSAMVGGERYQIFAIELEAGTVRRLTDTGSNEEPCFSADGRYIAFTSTRGDGRRAVWVMTADGRQPRKVTNGPGEYFTPAWERPRLEPSKSLYEPSDQLDPIKMTSWNRAVELLDRR